MTFTDEHRRLIGEASDTLVPEALFMVTERERCPFAFTDQVEAELLSFGVPPEEASERIVSAVVAGEVDVALRPNGDATLQLDPLGRLRIDRRRWFFRIADRGLVVPAHLPNETVGVRASIALWNDNYGEPPGTWDLVATICDLTGYTTEMTAVHALLNSVDAGAVQVAPEYDGSHDLRYYLTEGWVQP